MISRIASIVYWMTFAYTLRYIVKYFGRYRQTRSFSLGLVPGRTYFILAYPDHIELFYDVWFSNKFSFTELMDRTSAFREVYFGLAGKQYGDPVPNFIQWREYLSGMVTRVEIKKLSECKRRFLWTTPAAIKKLVARMFDPANNLERVKERYWWCYSDPIPAENYESGDGELDNRHP